MRTTAILTLAVAATLLSCDDAGSNGCVIVTDGERETFIHERAHCNGWVHEFFVVAQPPRQYQYDYPGHLTVIQCGGGKRHKAPAGTTFVEGCRSAARQCHKMWAERGYDVAAFARSPHYNDVNGCQFSN